jgi:hypothetical protein
MQNRMDMYTIYNTFNYLNLVQSILELYEVEPLFTENQYAKNERDFIAFQCNKIQYCTKTNNTICRFSGQFYVYQSKRFHCTT